MIEVRDLTFEYPGHRALEQVSFALSAGTITALVGPNGAGKTTLMRCLCGLERPLAGEITVDGIDVIETPRESHTSIGYLSDNFGLYDELTVAQCWRYAAAANGVTTGDLTARLAQTAQALHLQARMSQRAGELSRGLRQRVAIGQAIIHRPQVLILDEPASGLDPEARHDLAQLFKALQAAGMTLLVSSHILAELEEYATDMLIIRDGRVLEQRVLAPGADEQRQLVLTVLGDLEPAGAWLATRPEITHLEVEDEGFSFTLNGTAETQQRLLKELVLASVAVVSLGPVTHDLQQSYLRSLRQDRA